jgi:hypothetical protein
LTWKSVAISAHPLGDDERVRLSRRLEREAALLGDPVVLEVVPTALEDVREHRPGVPVPGDDALPGHAHEMRVLAVRHVEMQRPRPHSLVQRHPETVVDGPDVRHHEVRPHVVRLAPEIRRGGGVAPSHIDFCHDAPTVVDGRHHSWVAGQR